MLGVIFAARRKDHRCDLEALETATRAALHQAGAKLLEQLLEAPWEASRNVPAPATAAPLSAAGGPRK